MKTKLSSERSLGVSHRLQSIFDLKARPFKDVCEVNSKEIKHVEQLTNKISKSQQQDAK